MGWDRKHWTMGGGAIVFAMVAIPLFREFWEPGQPVWNAILLAITLGLIVGAVLMQRFFRSHIGEMGEARFDTRNKSDDNV